MARTKANTEKVSSNKVLGIGKKFTYKKERDIREDQEAIYLAIQRDQGKKRKSVPRSFLTSTTSKHAADGKRKNGIISTGEQISTRNTFLPGQSVSAKWKEGTKEFPNYYRATIVKRNKDGSYHLKYYDECEDKSVSEKWIRKRRIVKAVQPKAFQKALLTLEKKFKKTIDDLTQRIENLERNAPRDAVFTSKPVAKRKKVVNQTSRRICEIDTCTNEAVGFSKFNNEKSVCQSCHNAAKRRQKPKKAFAKPKIPGKPRHPGKTAKQFFPKSTIGKRNIKLREDGPAGPFYNDSEKAKYLEKMWKKLTPKEKEAVKMEYQKKKEAYKKRNEAYKAYIAQKFKNRFHRISNTMLC